METKNDNNKKPEENQGFLTMLLDPRIMIVIFLAAILPGILIGGGVYLWQEKNLNDVENNLNNEISNLEIELDTKSTQQAQTYQTLAERDQQVTELNQNLDQAATQVAYLEELMCKGAWVDGECLLNSCIDSDASEKPNDIYISGSVTTTDHRGVATTKSDTCTGSKKQVNEMWCYESPEGSGNYVRGQMVYNCPYGCDQGACVKGQ